MPSLVSSLIATPGVNGGTTGAIDTTGADLIVVGISWNGQGAGADPLWITDNKGNAYVALTKYGFVQGMYKFFYAQAGASPYSPQGPLIVGPGHTWTMATTNSSPVIHVYAFSGTGSFHSQNGANASGVTLATGSVTPPTNNCLLVTGFGSRVASAASVDNGFTQVATPLGASNVYGASGYLVQATAAAITPTWSWTTSSNNAVAIAVFRDSTPTPSIRETQLVADVASSRVFAPIRTTQFMVEVATTAALAASIRGTQVVVEVVTQEAPAVGGEKAFMFYD